MPATKPFTPTQERIGTVVVRVLSALNTWIFRASGGRFGARFPGGAPVLLLTTVGRKTGAKRTTPLIYLADGENVLLVASKGGMSHHPLWYQNLEVNPEVEVQVGRRTTPMRARRASPAEKASLWPRLVALYREYDDYQARTDRDIPVVILSPR